MRDHVLEEAERMVQERGFSAMSFAQLADGVGLSKASVFHHFPNKDALARALVDRCRTKYGVEYAEIVDAERGAPEKLQQLADVFEQGLRDERLCLLNALGQSVSSLSAEARDDLQVSVTASIERFARVFEQGRREGSLQFAGEPAEAAAAFLALIEGLQVLARAKRDHDLFRSAAASYVASLTR